MRDSSPNEAMERVSRQDKQVIKAQAGKQGITASSESPETPQPGIKKRLKGNASHNYLNNNGAKLEP